MKDQAACATELSRRHAGRRDARRPVLVGANWRARQPELSRRDRLSRVPPIFVTWLDELPGAGICDSSPNTGS